MKFGEIALNFQHMEWGLSQSLTLRARETQLTSCFPKPTRSYIWVYIVSKETAFQLTRKHTFLLFNFNQSLWWPNRPSKGSVSLLLSGQNGDQAKEWGYKLSNGYSKIGIFFYPNVCFHKVFFILILAELYFYFATLTVFIISIFTAQSR